MAAVVAGAPRVSVIMPFFNAERFLPEAVESVRAQTYPHWELLLIDDGSTDGSTSLAKQYASADPARIRYLAHPGRENRGASAARNLGIAGARGEYLALLDSDDVWLPHKLAEQVPLLDGHPQVGVLCGSTLIWYSWTGEAEDEHRDHLATVGLPHGRVVAPPDLLTLSFRAKIRTPCTCSILVRREALEAAGSFENRFRVVFTDQAFYAKLFLSTPFLVLETCWDKYRQHPDSSCSVADRTGRAVAAEVAYLDWLESYLKGRGLEGSQVWHAMKSYRYWRHSHPRLYALLSRGRKLAGKLRSRWERMATNRERVTGPPGKLR